jgi:hypothetical protein
MEKSIIKTKKLFSSLGKIMLILILLLTAVWMLTLLYFPETELKNSTKGAQKTEEAGIIRKIVEQKDDGLRDHFHMVDEDTVQSAHYEPVCMTCHGTYPHGKEKKVRAFLNFHSGFLACAVCHIPKDMNDKDHTFIWVNRETGKTSTSVEGGYGRYPAIIFPAKIEADGSAKVINPISTQSAKEYLKLKDTLSPDQIAQAKIKLHENISTKPVSCKDCHKVNGYLDFPKLGFPKNRVDNLTSTEAATMIDKYTTFYMPKSIDFGTNQ